MANENASELAGLAGRTFRGNSASAVLPIFSNTAQKVALWNPAGNSKIAKIKRLTLTYVSTTGAAGGFVLGLVANAGAAVATGGNVSAFTDGVLNTSIFNGRAGDLTGPTCRYTPSAATVTAPVVLHHLGLNQLVLTAADATNAQWKADFAFDGDLWLPPNNAIVLAGNIATLVTAQSTITWEEQDL
jgi:hypothetical protein